MPPLETLATCVREDMRRIASAVAVLRGTLESEPPAEPPTADALVGERLGALLGRRLEEVEGAVAVATALAERNAIELREELHTATQALAEELERAAAYTRRALPMHVDDVHRRIDAVSRELRTELAALDLRDRGVPSPYGERLAETLGRRLERLEGAVAVVSNLAERTGAEVRDELADVAAAGEFRRRQLASELAAVRERLEAMESRAARTPALELAVAELTARLEVAETDRDALTAQLVHLAETWADDRGALRERVAELAARIVTGPVPGPEDGTVWPNGRAFEQLRISVEGLRMRLAYHEKTVAELERARELDDRADEQVLLRRGLAASRLSTGGEELAERLEEATATLEARIAQLVPPPRSG